MQKPAEIAGRRGSGKTPERVLCQILFSVLIWHQRRHGRSDSGVLKDSEAISPQRGSFMAAQANGLEVAHSATRTG